MRAILSDIHSNLEALQAVLADIARQGVDTIYCLGDVVGYGPNPCECLDLVMQKCQVVLLGNHDQAVLGDPVGYAFNPTARRAILWTRQQLEGAGGDCGTAVRRLEFLAERPLWHYEDGLLFVHASPCNPLNEYVFPQDVDDPEEMERLFEAVQRCCFVGHTHMPGVFTEEPHADPYDFRNPEQLDGVYRLTRRKALVNVGSVGQPRDGDPRACYILLGSDAVRFRRVEYDLERTIRKMDAIPTLAGRPGDRLRVGH
jgi:diadenosine tetraphosphatase ApaH/serine/threonine PP2A family protein phosphatase